MEKVSITGLNLAVKSFQPHRAYRHGVVSIRKKLSREECPCFLAKQPRCIVAMEASGDAHHWQRAMRRFGHDVRLISAAGLFNQNDSNSSPSRKCRDYN
jgi:transposase